MRIIQALKRFEQFFVVPKFFGDVNFSIEFLQFKQGQRDPLQSGIKSKIRPISPAHLIWANPLQNQHET